MKSLFETLVSLLAVTSSVLSISCSRADVASGTRVQALDPSAWDSSIWISAPQAPVIDVYISDATFRSADGASWFVSTLKNDKKVTSAKWMTAGLGVYELYVNGNPVGEEVLKPGFTHYAKTKRSFTYDITDCIGRSAGAENQLSVQVTPGWWGDKIVTPSGHIGMIGQRLAFRGVVQLTYSDGTTRLYGTNLQDWKAGVAGPVRHAGIFDGEQYDAREKPGYAVADTFTAPVENTEFQGDILPSDGAEVYLRHDLALAPVQAYVWKDITGADDSHYGTVSILRSYSDGQDITLHPGETLVVDFGQNAAAVPSFLFKAAEGTVLTCLPSELLNDGNGARSRGMDGPQGSCHRQNLRLHERGIRLDYTFAGGDRFVSYYPHCTFFGYRFVSITATADVTIRSLRSIPVTSISAALETGTLTTGSEEINKIISNTLWSQRSNYLSVTTDCPQRNERLGWTADTQVFSETGSYFADTDKFFHKWTRDLRDTQSPLGGYPGVAPQGQYGSDPTEMCRIGWADAGVIVPWTIWKQFGDPQIIEENWDAMNLFIHHVGSVRYDHSALQSENGNYQWADWLSYEPLESCGGDAFMQQDGRGVPKPQALEYWNYLGASYWCIDADMMTDMAKAIGRDPSEYRQMAADAREYLKSRFLNDDGTFKLEILNTMQTPALFALKNHLVQGEAREAMIARLRQNFQQHDNCLQTGFLGTSILMETLTDNGMADIAYDLLFQHRNPSWLYSVDNGATTIWERWNSYTIENGMGPSGMNSFNHYAYGCVCGWLWKTAAGIAADPAQPGFRHIIMKPVPDRRLGSLNAEYRSAAGLITSRWEYQGDQWLWDFTIPEGATASVTLPGQTESRTYQSGSYHVEL